MSHDSYLTIARPGDAETEVKRSRFRAQARRVEDEEAARAFVEECRKTHWDAGHHCTAFVIGADGMLARSNDDGEPSGTAGAPILRTVQGRELSDVVVVVSRWFGGVLLGAGGLVRAYGDAASAALDAAGTRRRERLQEVQVRVPLADGARVENAVRSRGVSVSGVDWGQGAHAVVRAAVAPRELAGLTAYLEAETHGAALLEPGELTWVDSPVT